MENEIKTPKCLQCGSTNVGKRFDGQMFCRDCGAILFSCAVCGSFDIKKSSDGTLFCRECGARGDELYETIKQETAKEASNEPQQNNAVPFAVAPIGIVPAAGAVASPAKVSDVSAPASRSFNEEIENNIADDDYQIGEEDAENAVIDESDDQLIAPVICPQCGSNDIVKGPDGLHYCHACGTKIIIRDNEFEGSSDSDEVSSRGRIIAEIDKDTFMRSALIEVFEADTPSDIFDDTPYNFEESTDKILYDSVVCDVNYTVTIGTYREEHYVVTEKQKVSDNSRAGYHYENVQVEKTRTVTDWSPFGSSASGMTSTGAVTLDGFTGWSKMFCDSFASVDKQSIKPVSRAEEKELSLTDKALKAVNGMHVSNIQSAIVRTLPGDTYKNLHCDFHNEKFRHCIFIAPVYRLGMQNHGEDFFTRCYPFGKATVDVIGFSDSGTATDETNALLLENVKPMHIITIIALVAAIIVGFTVKSVAAVIATFGLALGSFIATCVKRGTMRKKIKDDIRSIKLDALNSVLIKFGLEKYKG